ncbi:cytochrome b [Pseudomonas sp. MF4836]|uniref:cytochrome b n=1 Tax=Pseudomonas sp. MF4836 TaxID=1960827 RepID=UPI000996CBDD|nr:cytochrome b/b6 domain-containing protein [Pseudomonas sp. MF4836]OOV89565.1 cytochrome B [Pseudomonas sp. MF4836]
MSAHNYSQPRRLLHWCSALIIIWASVSGFAVALLEMPHAIESGITFINVSLTALLIPLFALRLFFSVAHPAPPEPSMIGAASQVLAKLGHLALYIATALVLVTGVLMMNRPIDFFGLLTMPQPLEEPLLLEFFNQVHRACCVVLALLVLGHVGAVVLHQWRGHGVLQRMLP